MISIIVPVYNTEKYLDRCIQSILVQTYTDFELLLINDGSTDSSGAICDKYAEQDSRVRVFHKENGGVSSARNMGLDNVNGEWVTFVDSDDTINENYLKYLAPYDREEFVMGSSDVRSEALIPGLYEGLEMIKQIFSNWHILAIMDKLYKREIISKHWIRFAEGISYGEDTLFNLEYLLHVDKCRFSSTSEYNYDTEVENSLSKKQVSYEKSMMKAIGVYELGKKIASKYSNVEIEFLISRYAGITWTIWSSLLQYSTKERKKYIKQLFHNPDIVTLMSNYLKCNESGRKYALFYWFGRLRLYKIAACIISLGSY